MEQNLPAQRSGTAKELQTIAALIPAYNARETIGAIVSGTKRHVGYVLVIDDGSDDGTGKEAAGAGATVIRHLNNRGKGEALKTGFRFLVARGFDAVLTLDADGQHDPDDIPALVSRFEEGAAGIVIGTRMAQRDKIPRYRLIPNLVGNFFLSRASGRPIADSQCGMRVYAARVLKRGFLCVFPFRRRGRASHQGGKARVPVCLRPHIDDLPPGGKKPLHPRKGHLSDLHGLSEEPFLEESVTSVRLPIAGVDSFRRRATFLCNIRVLYYSINPFSLTAGGNRTTIFEIGLLNETI